METEEQRKARVAAAEARRARKREEWRRFQEGRHHGISEARAEERRLWAAGGHRLTTSTRIRDLLRAAFPAYACRSCGASARVEGMLPSHAADAARRGVCGSCYAWTLLHLVYVEYGDETRPPPWRDHGGVAFLERGGVTVELGILPTPTHPDGENHQVGEGFDHDGDSGV